LQSLLPNGLLLGFQRRGTIEALAGIATHAEAIVVLLRAAAEKRGGGFRLVGTRGA